MVASGVVSVYDAGTDAVWGIGKNQRLIAAFYRNTAIHILAGRAIAETALLAATETSAGGSYSASAVLDEALRLRELLKFEFLFAERADFERELADELRLIGVVDTATIRAPAEARRLLESTDLLLAHLVLRPFLDAYHLVADRLAADEDQPFHEKAFLAECLQIGRQWDLQRRIANAESLSMELFKTALRLAQHRDLIEGDDIAKRRQQFADEIATAVRRVNEIAELARTR
jgi:glycerol-3-phosphate O-acyltransferase